MRPFVCHTPDGEQGDLAYIYGVTRIENSAAVIGDTYVTTGPTDRTGLLRWQGRRSA